MVETGVGTLVGPVSSTLQDVSVAGSETVVFSMAVPGTVEFSVGAGIRPVVGSVGPTLQDGSSVGTGTGPVVGSVGPALQDDSLVGATGAEGCSVVVIETVDFPPVVPVIVDFSVVAVAETVDFFVTVLGSVGFFVVVSEIVGSGSNETSVVLGLHREHLISVTTEVRVSVDSKARLAVTTRESAGTVRVASRTSGV